MRTYKCVIPALARQPVSLKWNPGLIGETYVFALLQLISYLIIHIFD